MKKLSMGKTTFCCRNCQAATVVENEDLEKMTEFRCGSCGVPMSTARFAKLKMEYYARLYCKLIEPPFCGEGVEMFNVLTEFNPHYEMKQSETNENQEGV